MNLDHLTADQLRALHVTADERTRRAIKRRLQQLDDQPPQQPERKAPQMQESGFRDLFRSRLPPTTCAWSLADITETLDRVTVEWHENRKKRKK